MAVKAQAQVEITSVKDIKDAAEAAQDTAASSKITADSAATAAGTAQTAADAAQSSAATAAQAAATAQSTADAAKASASSAANAASAAQTKAEEAAVAAATAQSKADSAGTAASKAQSSANAAGEAASSAQAAAEAAQTAAGTAQADIDSHKEYFWHDANGAHVLGSKTAATRYRTDIDSEGMHIKDVSGEVQEVAKFTAEGAQIGKNGEARQNMDYNSWKLTDKDGNVFAEVSDLRGKDGTAEVIENLTANGIKYITLQMEPVSESETHIMVGTRKLMPGEYSISGKRVTLSTAPDIGTELKITYKTYSDLAKAYTFGKRLEDVGVGFHSFAEGHENRAYGTVSHAEGEGNESGGKASHAEGSGNVAKGDCSHVEGENNTAKGNCSHAEGSDSTASGDASHAEGSGTAIGRYSHAEGFSTNAKVQYSHAEGYETKATKDASHAEGAYTEARGKYSHAEGYRTIADTDYSHAEGWNTYAQGYASHAGGTGTFAGFGNQTAIGQYNDNQTDSLFEIGNGTSDTNRSNAFRVTKEGDVYSCGDIVPGKITGIANLIYPVGSIYMSTNATSPATLFGGTWERIQDRFLLAAGSIYNAGGMDGEATHTLTVDELPDHRHAFTTDSAGRHDHRAGYKRKDAYGKGTLDGQHWSNYNAGEVRTTSEGAHTHTGTTNGAGGTQPHNNMPPYLTVYMWKRTA